MEKNKICDSTKKNGEPCTLKALGSGSKCFIHNKDAKPDNKLSVETDIKKPVKKEPLAPTTASDVVFPDVKQDKAPKPKRVKKTLYFKSEKDFASALSVIAAYLA